MKTKKTARLTRVTIISLSIIALILVSAISCMTRKTFGKNPSGESLTEISKSDNYKDGEFQNLVSTPQLAEGYSFMGILYDKIFKNHPNLKPVDLIPSVKSDILSIPIDENVMIWFGHSSYFLQIDGVRFLVDPIFSGNASPIPNTVVAFEGTDIYEAKDLPEIDYLLISHDHYDHLDYETIMALKDQVKNVICGLGVGSHFKSWGYDAQRIYENDWNDSVNVKNNYTVFIEPARHFSGRGLKGNKTLWVSYVIKAPEFRIYLGGDSGYGPHYAKIGTTYGPFDLVALENGQYNKAWPYIHETPDQVLKAGKDLKAKRIFPVHSAKFALALHPWDEPLRKLTALNKENEFPLVTPKIGEIVYLDNPDQRFSKWWEAIR